MHCPSCGVETTEYLRYCKHCGANLSAPLQPRPPKKMPTGLIALFLLLVGFITVIGLTIPMAAAEDLIRSGFTPPGVTQIFLISALSVLAVDALLVWLLLHLLKIFHHADAPVRHIEIKQPVSRDYSPARIAAPPESVGSVTEHTTRNFEEYEKLTRARQSKRDTQ